MKSKFLYRGYCSILCNYIYLRAYSLEQAKKLIINRLMEINGKYNLQKVEKVQ